ENELEEQSAPGRMILQRIVELRREPPQLWEIVPENRGQIMVLIVIAHVQRHQIDRPVIAESLLVKIVGVMLLNPARAHRVQTDREEKRKRQVNQPRPAAKIHDCYVIERSAH